MAKGHNREFVRVIEIHPKGRTMENWNWSAPKLQHMLSSEYICRDLMQTHLHNDFRKHVAKWMKIKIQLALVHLRWKDQKLILVHNSYILHM
jgi:hypothetical protein